jgi:hypothetical protein
MPTPVPVLRGSFKNPTSALETTSHFVPPETGSAMEPDESTRKYMSTGTRCPSRTKALQTAPSPPWLVPLEPATARSNPPARFPPAAAPPSDPNIGSPSTAGEHDQPMVTKPSPARKVAVRVSRRLEV